MKPLKRPMRYRLLLLMLIAAAPATVPTTSPTTAPTLDRLPSLIDALGDRDPARRAAARETLMLLTRDDLPKLRDAVPARIPLQPTQRALLRDVVVQVYLVGKHGFAGPGAGYLGIASGGGNGPAIVFGCTPGNDGYRVFRPGDVVLAIGRVPVDGADAAKPMTAISGFAQLRAILDLMPVGAWVQLRVLREGVEQTVQVRLGPRPSADALAGDAGQPGVPPPTIDSPPPIAYDEGEVYWRQAFAPALAPTTRPGA